MSGRVLVVTNDFPPRRGGIESFVQSLCEGLDPRQVVVYTAATSGAEPFDASCAYRVLRDRRRMLLPTPAISRRVQAALLAEGCDRVVFGAAAPLGLLARRLRRTGAERIVAVTHGHEVWWARVPVARWLLRTIGARVDRLTYVSEYCRRRISPALAPAAQAGLAQLRPGVDTSRFHPGVDPGAQRSEWGIGADQPVVLAAARLAARKGHDVLIDAWPLVCAAHPDAVLVVLGDGRRAHALRRRARRHGVEAAVRIVAGVPWTAMPAAYAAADVFALPCRTRRGGLEPEALGIVFLEAAAAGLPVMVGRSGGAPDTVADGQTGYLVDPTDREQVAGRLIGLLDNPVAARAMGLRGRARIERDFGLADTQAAFAELIGLPPRHTKTAIAGRESRSS